MAAKRELTQEELEQRDLAIQTRKRPLHYDKWWLWPDDDAHRIRMENDMFRHFNNHIYYGTTKTFRH